MPRIVYALLCNGGIQGGHKMIVRHVETLRDLGFDAICYLPPGGHQPSWFEHSAPIEVGTNILRDDVVVLPDDADEAIRAVAASNRRAVVFVQNPYYFTADAAFRTVVEHHPGRFNTFMAVGPRLAATLGRLFPRAEVALVPCFADERRFRPDGPKRFEIGYAPRKRPLQVRAIQAMFERLHPEHADLAWTGLNDASESEMAALCARAGLWLSLNHLESVGMTTLEAMASGALCVGFTGVGGEEYATPENGWWAASEDCEAVADFAAEAADLVKTGGPQLARRVEAGRETAARWSYAAFREALEATWMRLAPEARIRNGPLD